MNIEFKDGRLEVNGLPDAKILVKLPRELSQGIADLRLHHTDLEIALNSIEGINKAIHAGIPDIVESLWRSGIIHFIKCFSGQKSRDKLDPDIVYSAEPEEAIQAFKYFKNLRNKHIAHDDNAYLQALTGLALNDGSKNYKIEKVLCFSLKSNTVENDNYGNLLLLINRAKDYVDSRFYKLCDEITANLESMSYAELLALGELTFKAPELHELSKTRQRE